MARSRDGGPPRKVTITTVAERAGVSVATVSRVMNDIPTVGPELAARVRQAAAETGYRPNAVAQGLARGTLRTLGVVVTNLANPYYHQILKSIEASARSNDFRMLIADSNEDPEEEFAICVQLARQVDSLILCSPRMPTARLMEVRELAPTVAMTNRHEEDVPISAVCVDSRDAMTALGTHLRDHGHRRIVYLAGPEGSWAAGDRMRSLMDQQGFEVSVVACGGTIDDGYRSLPAALDLEPTAIVAFNDLVAFGALSRSRELGIGVPDRISLTGFDDIPFSSYVSPPLTSVRYPHQYMGTCAWELVADESTANEQPTLTLLPTELIERSSTGRACTTTS